MKENKYLPLGTVVILRNAEKRTMIIGYTVVVEEKRDKIYDYIGCPYPEVIINLEKTMAFDNEDIEKIYYTGYNNEESEEFHNKLEKYVLDTK